MRIDRVLLDEIIEHARAEAPNECCGIVAADDGRAVRVFRARNIHASPVRYEVDPRDEIRIFREVDDAGWDYGAIYHSHTHTEPVPSQTDINLARHWPDQVQIIVGLAGEEPDVRAWRIHGGDVERVELEVA
jgi:[CysO sulfur-carrier protein]-S-L-cysteine hydrolase